MELPSYKGGDILVDKFGNAFLLLHDIRFDKIYHKDGSKTTIPYAEIEILLKSCMTPDINITRLLGGDFKRCKKMTYPQAEKIHGVQQVLYGKKA